VTGFATAIAEHLRRIAIQNNDAITADNGAVVTLYIQSFGLSP
jgi:hypothetical protein